VIGAQFSAGAPTRRGWVEEKKERDRDREREREREKEKERERGAAG